ncbi:Membrane protein involved in the export of O-antigen and teichoic acid [Pontibacter indicus]|uniref:Membrane protein involved in the export of O-antigen and teichoic acid n=2 Tax=Pontibacter indicus TaxID=1317125 RepID=A0A1R3WBN5_9BACT|nr:Membrane protein involved in the export of O-antigen and teichoic acid [Pontibacter indicus]
MYGMWQMLSQMTGFANIADTRATQVLKWSIAQKRDLASDQELKSDLTTALVVTTFILPIILIIGSVIIWYAPNITHAAPEYHNIIRIACSLLLLTLITSKVFDLFESVIRGMNMGYKRMGFRAGIIFLAGGLKVFAITQGYGLIGLSTVEFFTALLIGTTFYYIVKKNIPWFGFAKTNTSKIISYSRLSGWFMASTGSKMFLLSSDKLLLGYLAGPVFVTKYAITLFTSYALQGLITAVVNGVIPGMGGLFGKGEYNKVQRARKMIMILNWVLTASLGVAILLYNRSFISLWVGEEHYAGNTENLLILLIAVQAIFFQIDSLIINVSLDLKMKVYISVLASAITISMSFFLIEHYQIIGLCISILVGRLVLSVGYPLLLGRVMHMQVNFTEWKQFQPILITALLFALATHIGQSILITNWVSLIAIGVLSVPAVGIIFWLVGLRREEREIVKELTSKIELFKRDDN